MKLLLDENLSRRLIRRINDLFPDVAHVSSFGRLSEPDSVIWDFAKRKEYCIVSADADFYELATSLGPPPKVIWLRECDYPTETVEKLIRNQAIRIRDFLDDPERAVLILQPK